MKIILNHIEPDDFILGARAAKWILARPDRKDAVISYGDGPQCKDFYIKRNKSSITIRPCYWANETTETLG